MPTLMYGTFVGYVQSYLSVLRFVAVCLPVSRLLALLFLFPRRILRYYGRHAYKQGFRCGVELIEPKGSNNGSVEVPSAILSL